MPPPKYEMGNPKFMETDRIKNINVKTRDFEVDFEVPEYLSVQEAEVSYERLGNQDRIDILLKAQLPLNTVIVEFGSPRKDLINDSRLQDLAAVADATILELLNLELETGDINQMVPALRDMVLRRMRYNIVYTMQKFAGLTKNDGYNRARTLAEVVKIIKDTAEYINCGMADEDMAFIRRVDKLVPTHPFEVPYGIIDKHNDFIERSNAFNKVLEKVKGDAFEKLSKEIGEICEGYVFDRPSSVGCDFTIVEQPRRCGKSQAVEFLRDEADKDFLRRTYGLMGVDLKITV